MIKPTLLNGGRMHGKSRLRAYENLNAELEALNMNTRMRLRGLSAKAEARRREGLGVLGKSADLIWVDEAQSLPQYPRAPKTTVSVTVDPASPGGDKSVEVTFKDGVIVKTKELK